MEELKQNNTTDNWPYKRRYTSTDNDWPYL